MCCWEGRIAEIELETETGSENLLTLPVVLMAIKMVRCMWVMKVMMMKKRW